MKNKKLFTFIIIFISISFSVNSQPIPLPEKGVKIPQAELPQTIEEAGLFGKDFLNFLPGQIREGWNIAIGIWTNMYFKTVSLVSSGWNTIRNRSKEEIEEKKDILREELEKEKEEAQEKAKESGKVVVKSLWQRILESLKLK